MFEKDPGRLAHHGPPDIKHRQLAAQAGDRLSARLRSAARPYQRIRARSMRSYCDATSSLAASRRLASTFRSRKSLTR